MWYEIDVSGLHIGPIFKRNMSKYILTLEMGPISNAETSVSNHLTPRNNPEDGRIQHQISQVFLLFNSLRHLFVCHASAGEEEIIETEKISCKINYSSGFKF